MERKDFIKKAALGGLAISILSPLKYFFKGNTPQDTKCDETPELEEGPFPNKEPNRLVTKNIVSDRAGAALGVHIAVYNVNDQCKAMKDALVDIWHCDHKGEYSEYGGVTGFGPPPNGHMRKPPPRRKAGKDDRRPPFPPPGGMGGMQPADHTEEHFLRGRQSTGETGIALFDSIYPGWYGGRAPHIHAHIFDKNGRSLLITQIAFPENISRQVYGQGVYAAHGQADTSNAADHVFGDGVVNELAAITGNLKDGFILTHRIYVKA